MASNRSAAVGNKFVSVLRRLSADDKRDIKSLFVKVGKIGGFIRSRGRSGVWNYFGELCFKDESGDVEPVDSQRHYCSLCLTKQQTTTAGIGIGHISWNSSLHMIDSLISLRPEVNNALKQTGHYDMCLKAHEWAEAEELRNFLQTFAGLTDLVSSSITSLSLIPLIRAEIVDACKSDLTDGDSLKSLKKLILKSVDKRLPMTDDIILATLFDPSAKSLVSQLSDDGKEQLVYKAVREQARKAAMQNNTSSVSIDASATLQSAESTSATESSSSSSVPGATLSKKMKLVQKHTPHSEQPDCELIEQIKNYLRYLPVGDDEDPLAFWKKGFFQLLKGLRRNISPEVHHPFLWRTCSAQWVCYSTASGQLSHRIVPIGCHSYMTTINCTATLLDWNH